MPYPDLATGTAARPATSSRNLPVVYVVDDDVGVRESLDLLIRSAGWQPQMFECGQEFLAHPPVFVPNCLILDVHWPDLSGLDLQRRIAAERSDTSIIVVTCFGDVPTTVRAMKAGAVEFLMKPFRDELLIDAIEQGLERSRVVREHDAEMRVLQDRYASLSHREQDVMKLVVAGLLNKQVGYELGISEITVKAHRGRVMRKMASGSLADLVNMAARLGITR